MANSKVTNHSNWGINARVPRSFMLFLKLSHKIILLPAPKPHTVPSSDVTIGETPIGVTQSRLLLPILFPTAECIRSDIT